MTNDWTDRNSLEIPQPQSIDRVEVMAYLKDSDKCLAIDAIVRNKELIDLDLRGHQADTFDSLADDVSDKLKGVYTGDCFKQKQS